jgi:hypothetical protein
METRGPGWLELGHVTGGSWKQMWGSGAATVDYYCGFFCCIFKCLVRYFDNFSSSYFDVSAKNSVLGGFFF